VVETHGHSDVAMLRTYIEIAPILIEINPLHREIKVPS
jgi:hypothetical protein